MKRLLAIAFFSATPMAATAGSLGAALSDYVVAFDIAALDTDARTKLRRIIEDQHASHGEKVLGIHTVLERYDALRHVDIHGEPLQEPSSDAQVGLASLF